MFMGSRALAVALQLQLLWVLDSVQAIPAFLFVYLACTDRGRLDCRAYLARNPKPGTALGVVSR